MHDEVALFPASPEGFDHLDFVGPSQSLLEDQLVFGPGALAVHVLGMSRTVLGGRTPAAALG